MLAINNKNLNWNKMPLTLAPQYTYLGINLTKHTQNLYVDNYKTVECKEW